MTKKPKIKQLDGNVYALYDADGNLYCISYDKKLLEDMMKEEFKSKSGKHSGES